MVAVIAAQAVFSAGETGKAAIAPRVLEAMAKLPRHDFVPAEVRPYAYADSPLPIGCSKTISQPFIVALMTDLLDLKPEDQVLEIGTGLGYHAAILSELVQRVYSVEIIEELAQQAKQRLARQRCANVELRLGNGYYGWPEHAPFNKVIVAAGVELVPPPLLQQLKPGGRLVIPTGLPDSQQLMLVEKDVGGRVKMKEILRVRFSLLEGEPA
ncbi:MAG TPA: protein-L-isoaspartate(D-aspartate) O-methyltransferase [Burkholderiales bacterium]|nr:protein-L-isoaspartate(D-aspartate) O-methyltransferase [Burkholderiales bacterium]